MIIVLCGKGGCGKSTITSMLAHVFAERGKRVLVIDMDESNFGLHRQLGMELPEDFTLYFGSKKGIFAAQDALKEGEQLFSEKWKIDTLPEKYVSCSDGIRLAAVGKIHEAGEGCACPMGSMAKALLDNLELGADDVVLADMEAGVEHFGRGIDAKADRILMVADPSFESVSLTEKIGGMCEKLGKPYGILLNKVTPEQEQVMRKTIRRAGSIIGAVYQNEKVLTEGLLGEKLDVLPEEVKKIADNL